MKLYYLIGSFYFLLISCTYHKVPIENVVIKADSDSILKSKIIKRDTVVKINPMDEKVMNLIGELPEVKVEWKMIDSLSKHSRRMSIMVEEEPDSVSPYYWVKVGENNGVAFHTDYNFLVNPTNFKILYVDPISGNNISLKELRRLRKENPSVYY